MRFLPTPLPPLALQAVKAGRDVRWNRGRLERPLWQGQCLLRRRGHRKALEDEARQTLAPRQHQLERAAGRRVGQDDVGHTDPPPSAVHHAVTENPRKGLKSVGNQRGIVSNHGAIRVKQENPCFIGVFIGFSWWPRPGSNRRHTDFQSVQLSINTRYFLHEVAQR